MLGVSVGLLATRTARASSFDGRLLLGPGYMQTNTSVDRSDSSGPALLTQLDLGVRLRAPLVLHGTLIYDHSSWLDVESLTGRYRGSMLGFGLGATLNLGSICLGAVVGGQFTSFPEANDPSSGPTGASLGPLLSASAGYVWNLAEAAQFGVHALVRYRRSKDETLSMVYDPEGYQLGLAVSIGIAGEALLGSPAQRQPAQPPM